jgi:hypothetical protein
MLHVSCVYDSPTENDGVSQNRRFHLFFIYMLIFLYRLGSELNVCCLLKTYRQNTSNYLNDNTDVN